MLRTLWIAADPQLLATLSEQFKAVGGHELRAFETNAPLAPPWPNAVLLDAETCAAHVEAARLRAAGFRGAILTIGADTPDADATLTRPFRFAELLARLEAPPQHASDARSVNIQLTEKEAAILERLAKGRGAIIPKATLLAEVWGYGPNVSTRTLETHIHRLRRKIETEPGRPKKLLTEAGGYRLADTTDDETPQRFTP